jgi:hypothetical protein
MSKMSVSFTRYEQRFCRMPAEATRYHALAANCEARAATESDPVIRQEWAYMARSYKRLAEQAERNARLNGMRSLPRARDKSDRDDGESTTA